MDSFYRVATTAALAAALVGCAGTKEAGKSIEVSSAGLEARLIPTGSSAAGAVRLFDSRDGVSFQMQLVNVPMGTYRVALHEKGNCGSPNLFSAGPAWAPPESGRPAAELLPPFNISTDGDAPPYVAFIRGVRTEGPGPSLRGRLVVVYFGAQITDAFPGQPNNRIACGVFQPVKPLF
jgi:Cu/Zn superoxide dismutase